jgi:hypothetical protein
LDADENPLAAFPKNSISKKEQGASPLQTKQALLQTKKEQGASPARKIVSTLFSRKFGFDLD